jgi:hypothetical protein
MTHRIFTTSFAGVYPLYVAKVTKKGRTTAELDAVIEWLTGYDADGLAAAVADGRNLEDFFTQAPAFNPDSALITGVVCGLRVEQIEDPLMRKLRYLDKLVDELAKGKALSAVLRSPKEGGT